MADETEEVRSLLSRHRLTIVRELVQTNLVQILVKNSVINVEDEELISGESDLERRCDHLIEIIAKFGFEKFKQFCYAIETECSQLISDLINDKLSQSVVEDTNEDASTLANDDSSIKNGRDTIDSNRSRRSTSYCGSATPTPIINSSSRRSSLVCNTPVVPNSVPPPIPQLPVKPIPASNNSSIDYSSNKTNNYDRYSDSKFSVSNSNFNNQVSQNGDSSSPPVQKIPRSAQASPYGYINPKRFSSPPFSDFACDKGVNVKNRSSSIIRSKSKKEQRNYHSMNETIEVMADQVVEDDRIGATCVSLERNTASSFCVARDHGGIPSNGSVSLREHYKNKKNTYSSSTEHDEQTKITSSSVEQKMFRL